jgi:hypothetical protein
MRSSFDSGLARWRSAVGLDDETISVDDVGDARQGERIAERLATALYRAEKGQDPA